MIKVLQRNQVAACGKHFPGHGDTQIDSHISLPIIGKELASLQKSEFVPFQRAINQGVSMIMLGHLSVPALDPSGRPASVSEKAVAHLRAQMGFRGTIITDAMNMGGIGQFTENEASQAALDAGVDIILHPSDPDAVASYLGKKDKGSKHRPKTPIPFRPLSMENTEELRGNGEGTDIPSDFTAHQRLSDELATMAVFQESENPFTIVKPFLILMNEEKVKKGEYLVHELRQRYPALQCRWIFPGDDMPWSAILKDHDLIVSVFSQIRAWKGQTAGWLRKAIESVNGRAKIVVSFGNPYVLSGVRHTGKIYAFWDSVSAQKAVAERLAH
jgi:hypothetical protein